MLLNIDPLSQVLERMRYDRETGDLVITYEQQADRIIKRNEIMRNDPAESWRGESNDFWKVGSVPEYLLYNWLAEFNLGKPADERVQSIYHGDARWNRYIMDKLNMGEFVKLKTAPVKL